MNEILDQLYKFAIIPVVELTNLEDATPLANALCQGGLPCAEITFRTAAAEESIKIITSNFPNMLIGAGTILTIEQVDCAINAGAKFIVSPGLNPEVVQYCVNKNIPILPGTITPSEMEQAINLGLTAVKFFPAEPFGGIDVIKAVASPYTKLKFMPTGGINTNNIKNYLSCDKIIACGGSWMVSKSLIDSGNFNIITELTKEAVSIVKDIRGNV